MWPQISSSTNEKIKSWRKLHTTKGRKKSQSYLIEGWHLLEEALVHQLHIEAILLHEDLKDQTLPLAWPAHQDTYWLSDAPFKVLQTTETSQGVLAVLAVKSSSLPEGSHYLLVDRVQDPGNLGTLIRTADAAGFSAVFLSEGTVDPYNDKVIRASQGSLFHLPILQGDLAACMTWLKARGVTLFASALNPQALSYEVLKGSDPLALIVGNEGQGVSARVLEACDQQVYIPIYGQAESLNVAMAGSIMMYKAVEGKFT